MSEKQLQLEIDRHSSDQDDDDDDFNDLYKEYTGPPKLEKSPDERPVTNKRSLSGSDEDEDDPDPNAVPTDFTSREKKVWDAKSKATERNWKKRKEEEMICKLCGDPGHFTQGCPSTLGANGKEFFQRVAARDKRIRALFTGIVMANVEKEIGCKLRIDEKFIFVSGKDRLILAKGVDAVHKLINDDGDKKEIENSVSSCSKSPNRSPAHLRSAQYDSSPRTASQVQPRFSKHEKLTEHREKDITNRDFSNSHVSRSKSPDRGPNGSRISRSEPQKAVPSPRDVSPYQPKFVKHDQAVEDSVRDDLQKMSKDSTQACGSNGAKGPSSWSNSPPPQGHSTHSNYQYDSRSQGMGPYRPNDPDTERRRSVIKTPSTVDNPFFSQALEELELEFVREATDIIFIRDKEEDEENCRHRKAVREIRDGYMKKLSVLRSAQAKEWENFLHLDAHRRNQQLNAQQQTEQVRAQHPASCYSGGKQAGYGGDMRVSYEGETQVSYGGDTHASYMKYDSGDASATNRDYPSSRYPMDGRGRYSRPGDYHVTSRENDNYEDYQRHRRGDIGRSYNRY